MWRLTILLGRDAAVASEAFMPRLLEAFVPAVLGAIGDDLRLRRLIANIRPDDLEPAVAAMFPPRFDGLLELWFETQADAEAVSRLLAGSDACRAAAQGLIDGANGIAWLAEVFPIKAEIGVTRIKFMAGGDVALGWAVDAAQRYWRDVHPGVAQTVPSVWARLARYVQFHGRDAPDLAVGDWLARVRFVPMCADMGFARAEDFLLTYGSADYLRVIRPDEEKFSRPGEMLAFVSGDERDLLGRPA
jgi:hypothetical protein